LEHHQPRKHLLARVQPKPRPHGDQLPAGFYADVWGEDVLLEYKSKTINKIMADNKLQIRNSTAEFLTFTAEGATNSVEVFYEDETIWLSQKMMAVLFDVDVRTVNEHLKNLYEQGEITGTATIRNFRIVQTEGSRQVTRNVDFYNLDAIISVGYRVNSIRATQFRQWATSVLRNFAIRGYVIDRKRMENGAFLGEDKEELASLGHIVNAYLDLAEDRAKRHVPMTMEDWAKRLDVFLAADDRDILQDSGATTAQVSKDFAESEFEKYRIVQDRLFESDFDRELKQIEI
jgi:hypothetical protein